ncbi:hypothetical protein L1887_08796 [Cichorium endivia]|nr:hypothetical protein L1887_08796 [Cichorium endivia]
MKRGFVVHKLSEIDLHICLPYTDGVQADACGDDFILDRDYRQRGLSAVKVKDGREEYGGVWREFLWGALASGFGEGMIHPIDTVKTQIKSQAILTHSQVFYGLLQFLCIV